MSKYFGPFIKLVRKYRNLTIKDAGELTGISNANLCDLETGVALNPTAKTLISLHKHYHIDYEAMLEWLEKDLDQPNDNAHEVE